MRRGGQNPTESEVQDMINSVSKQKLDFELLNIVNKLAFPLQTEILGPISCQANLLI